MISTAASPIRSLKLEEVGKRIDHHHAGEHRFSGSLLTHDKIDRNQDSNKRNRRNDPLVAAEDQVGKNGQAKRSSERCFREKSRETLEKLFNHGHIQGIIAIADEAFTILTR